ncbi:MAG: cupin domain-containing protein [Candidatus Gastranaerophilales bacterium]|nr:cupin domain-containing protein [Candidatus Gastranaerophilales bacterium]
MLKVIEKPWGKEEIIELNSKYMVKRLTMFANHRCSLQYHNNKCETIYVLSGQLKITLGKTKDSLADKIYESGEFITIQPLEVHRMEAVTDSVYLEASTPETDDTIRLTDDYNRC